MLHGPLVEVCWGGLSLALVQGLPDGLVGIIGTVLTYQSRALPLPWHCPAAPLPPCCLPCFPLSLACLNRLLVAACEVFRKALDILFLHPGQQHLNKPLDCRLVQCPPDRVVMHVQP